MAIKSFPYVSIDGDRKITASDEAAGYDLFVSSGSVTGLAITKIAGTLNVSIAAGSAVIAGHRYIQDSAETLTLDAGGAQPRIDIIALESNANTSSRAAAFVVVKGTAAAAPEAPALTETAAVYQQSYARIAIPASAASLDSATLTDTHIRAVGRHTHATTDVTGLTAALAGKAASTHAHAASDVTGLTAALAGKAASTHAHAASDVTSGTLAAERGGTGQTSLQATRNAMGLGNTTGALPVANGGTGGTTAAAGREGLDIYVVDALPASPVTGRIYIVKRS